MILRNSIQFYSFGHQIAKFNLTPWSDVHAKLQTRNNDYDTVNRRLSGPLHTQGKGPVGEGAIEARYVRGLIVL